MIEKQNLTQGVADKEQEHFRVPFTMTQASPTNKSYIFPTIPNRPILKTTHFPTIPSHICRVLTEEK